jgi:hypothetical protein
MPSSHGEPRLSSASPRWNDSAPDGAESERLMSDFTEPETLATFDRSWKGQKEQLRLERSEFNGRPVYTLRLYWQNEAGEWRWQPAKATANGRYWQALTLKAKELRELGLALVAEADELEYQRVGTQPAAEPRGLQSRKPSEREQGELDRFDARTR